MFNGVSASIASYLAALPESRRERGEAIHRRVKKLFPKATCDFSYRMPTYHVGDHFFAWKSQKAYLSIYTCSAERIASFTKKHPNIPCGVGCINFRDRDPFPLRDLAAVIKNAFAPSAMILDAKNTATNRQIVISFENLPFSPKLTEPPPYTASDDGKAL